MSAGFLLDTCTISEPTRPRPDAAVLAWLNQEQHSPRCHLSVITVAEIQQGISRLDDLARAGKLRAWLEQVVLPRFHGRILDVDIGTAKLWGDRRGQAMRKGRALTLVDSLLAATALTHGLTVATRNVRDFETMGVTVFNPWASPR
ncbi:MAG: type II toxin-antitoxin system VapC family toxin [Lysobacterales bacterium]